MTKKITFHKLMVSKETFTIDNIDFDNLDNVEDMIINKKIIWSKTIDELTEDDIKEINNSGQDAINVKDTKDYQIEKRGEIIKYPITNKDIL